MQKLKNAARRSRRPRHILLSSKNPTKRISKALKLKKSKVQQNCKPGNLCNLFDGEWDDTLQQKQWDELFESAYDAIGNSVVNEFC